MKEYPGLGVNEITDLRIAELEFHSLRLVSLKIWPPKLSDIVKLRSSNRTSIGSKFPNTE